MKKYLLKMGLAGTLLLILTLATTSCQNAEEPFTPSFPVEPIEEEYVISPQMTDFYTQLDSLNRVHVENSSRLGVLGTAGKKLADMGGKCAGRWIGKRLGAAAGAATGNPMLAVLGYVGGGNVGGFLGYHAASAVAECVISKANGKYGIPQGQMKLICDYQLRPSDYVDESVRSEYLYGDSLGSIHNEIMLAINMEKDQMFDENGEPTFVPLYNQMQAFLKKHNKPLNIMEPGGYRYINVPMYVIRFAKDIANMALEITETNGELSIMRDNLSQYFSNNNVPRQVIESFNNFEYTMVETSEGMTETELRAYAAALKRTIDNSNMTNTEKYDHAQRADAFINCALIWSQAQ